MTAEEARARAFHYRQLAWRVMDDKAHEELLKLAAEYEVLADRTGDTDGSPQCSGTSQKSCAL
jgi:hypothetical protein